MPGNDQTSASYGNVSWEKQCIVSVFLRDCMLIYVFARQIDKAFKIIHKDGLFPSFYFICREYVFHLLSTQNFIEVLKPAVDPFVSCL